MWFLCARSVLRITFCFKRWSLGPIDLIAKRSSGQFIYAAIVVQLLGANFCSPIRDLALILMPDPMVFSSLDHLYIRILSKLSDGSVYVMGIWQRWLKISSWWRKVNWKLLLRGLPSLMKDEKDECLRGLSSHSIQVARAHSMSIDRNIKIRLLYGTWCSLCNRLGFGLGGKYLIWSFFSRLIIYNQIRIQISPVTWVLHTTA